MKRIGASALVALLALVGCENSSRLDNTKAMDKAPAADRAGASAPVADHSGTLEDRVARLESNYAKYAEALDFLGKVYAQQKAQQQQQERNEPAPDAVFAVDIAPDVKLGETEGPATAPITIVEAWDFA
jgi:hypothetical protein